MSTYPPMSFDNEKCPNCNMNSKQNCFDNSEKFYHAYGNPPGKIFTDFE